MARIGRVLTAMVTPFGSDGAVDYAQAARLATALLASGSDGLVVTGTTGESPVLSHDEKLRLYETTKRAVGERGTIIAGVGSYDTAASVALAREAREAGADGFLLVVPYYNKPPQEGLYRHFTTIADATNLPCILYNVPSRTVTNLAAETVARLSGHPHIVGIKEASGNLDQISKIIASCPEDFLVWSGNDGDTLPMLALGGYGVVSVASHVVGRQIRDMIERFVAGDTKGAAAIHHRLLPLVNALFIVANPIPVKHALNHVGFRVGPCRLPLVEMDAKSAAVLEAELARLPIDLPVAV